MGTETRVRFTGSCLKQDKTTYTHRKIVNIYFIYDINKNDNTNSAPTLENCLFRPVILPKYNDIDNDKYCGHGIGFDKHRFFSHPSGGTGQM